jgi:hypothetical protein
MCESLIEPLRSGREFGARRIEPCPIGAEVIFGF